MSVTRDAVLDCLSRISLPDGGTLLSRDLVRALDVEGGMVRFVIEAADAAEARALA
ncbi:MAG: iron-sulfur cluster assembly protein, partial [Albidovulum sp.]